MKNTRSIFELKDDNLKVKDNIDDYKIQEKSEDEVFEALSEIEEIYESDLDITSLSLVKAPQYGGKAVYKCIYKDNLMTKAQLTQARIEFALQASLNHVNIVRCYSYGENEETVHALLEYIN